VPVGSGPYTIGAFEPGRFVTFRRNPDYWGARPALQPRPAQFDTIRYDFFVDAGVLFQAFTAGELSVYREANPTAGPTTTTSPPSPRARWSRPRSRMAAPRAWRASCSTPAAPIFADWRVRDALIHAFNFEFVNQTLNAGIYPRRTSYFANSGLAMGDGPAEGRVRELLEPFADGLVPGALDAYALPASDGSQRNRANMRRAGQRCSRRPAGPCRAASCAMPAAGPSTFTILLQSGQSEAVTNIFVDALRQLGITATVAIVDSAQYNERRSAYDFDMIINAWNMSLSPGNEQYLYWGRAGVETPGTRNYMGLDSPAAEAMIDDHPRTRDRGGVDRRHAGARPGADHRTLRHPVLVLRHQPHRPQGGAQIPRGAAGLRRLDRLAARGLVVRTLSRAGASATAPAGRRAAAAPGRPPCRA
jgi:peptide/nickel transport system substrate-binding protein